MLKVLWVEDDKDNIEEYKDDDFDKIFESIIPASFKESCLCTQNSLKYDFAVIDIDLSKFSDFNQEYTSNIKKEVLFEKFENKDKTFSQVAGFVIYSKLLEYGFPKERILFLTANVGSQNNTYNEFEKHFTQALTPLPEYIIKDINAPEELTKKLKLKINDYLNLRRGIIEDCNALKELIKKNDDNIQLRDFVKGTNGNNAAIEILTPDIENYLDTIAQFLPARKPEAINDEYRLFLRALVHEWEQNIDPQELPKEKYFSDIHTFAWLSKQTRNWVSHAKLLEPLNSEIIAFLFLVNMRAMFKLPVEVQRCEDILLKCISKEPADCIDNDEVKERINDSNINVDSILESIPLIEKTDKCGKLVNREKKYFEKRYFSEKINDIYLHNTGKTKNHDYQTFLFQLFWANQQKYLAKLTANSDDFLPTLARHIYNHSFLKNTEV